MTFNSHTKPIFDSDRRQVTDINHIGGGNLAGKTELLRRRMAFVHHVNNLVAQAAELGVVLTIEQKPLLPLAMGNYETLVSIRPVRS